MVVFVTATDCCHIPIPVRFEHTSKSRYCTYNNNSVHKCQSSSSSASSLSTTSTLSRNYVLCATRSPGIPVKFQYTLLIRVAEWDELVHAINPSKSVTCSPLTPSISTSSLRMTPDGSKSTRTSFHLASQRLRLIVQFRRIRNISLPPKVDVRILERSGKHT